MGRGAASPRHQCEGLTVARSQNPRQDFSTGKDPWRFCHPLKLSPARPAGQRRRGAAGDLCPRAAQPRGTGAAIGPQPVIFGEHHRRAHDQLSRPGGRGGDAESDPGWTTWDPSGTRSGGRLFCRSRDRRGAHHRASHRPSRRCDRLSSRPVRWPVRASHRSGRPGRRYRVRRAFRRRTRAMRGLWLVGSGPDGPSGAGSDCTASRLAERRSRRAYARSVASRHAVDG